MPIPLIPLAAIAALSLFGVVKHVGHKMNRANMAKALDTNTAAYAPTNLPTARNNVEISSSMALSLVINGVDYNFSFSPSLHGPKDLAAEFCKTKGREFLTDFKSCTAKVATAIADKIEATSKKSDIVFDMRPHYNVKMPTGSPAAAAGKSKIVSGEVEINETGGTTTTTTKTTETTTTMGETAEAEAEVEVEVETSQDPVIDSKSIVLEVNGINFVFEYPTSLSIEDAAPRLASAFCHEKVDVLGIAGYSPSNSKEVNDAIIAKECVPPVRASLIQHGNNQA